MAKSSTIPIRSATLYALLVTWLGTIPAAAAGFRVDSAVYSNDTKPPVSRNTTVFHDDVVYDFVEGGNEVTVLQPASRRFVVLDLQRQIKTRISTDDIVQFTSWLKDTASKADDPLLNFCVQPDFEVTNNPLQRQWSFHSKVLSYQIVAVTPPSKKMADQYRTFCDWYARLNCIFRPQSLPPFPRLVVNERLSREHLMPQSVRLRISPQRRTGSQETTIRSVHQVSNELTSEDISRINRVQRQIASFKEVTLNAYQGFQRTAGK